MIPQLVINAEYFVCSEDFLIVNPIDGKKLSWSNYDDPSLYKNSDENIYKYRMLAKISKKKIKEAKKQDPEFFKGKN